MPTFTDIHAGVAELSYLTTQLAAALVDKDRIMLRVTSKRILANTQALDATIEAATFDPSEQPAIPPGRVPLG